jgi:hypothetical protein
MKLDYSRLHIPWKRSEKDIEDSAVTDLGYASSDITSTANVSRASIAKGKGTQEIYQYCKYNP